MNRKLFFGFLFLSIFVFAISSCEKDDANPYDGIKSIPSITIGAQTNPTIGAFYSIEKNKVYTQAEAFDDQESIDILCFWEAYNDNFNTLASPGSNIKDIFTGETAPESWDTLNTTLFYETLLTAEAFDAITVDTLIVPNFAVDINDGSRKAKALAAGDVYAILTKVGGGQKDPITGDRLPFVKTSVSKYGLIKIIAVDGEAEGSIEFALKIQE